MLFIIWFSLRLLLLVPNWDTMFFLCYNDHFCTFVSLYCYTTVVERTSYSLAGLLPTIRPFSTSSSMYLPGSCYVFCPERRSSPSLVSILPSLVPFIWLNCSILTYFRDSFIVVAIYYQMLYKSLVFSNPVPHNSVPQPLVASLLCCLNTYFPVFLGCNREMGELGGLVQFGEWPWVGYFAGQLRFKERLFLSLGW